MWKLKQTFTTPNTTCVAAVHRASPFRTSERERHLIVMNINDGSSVERRESVSSCHVLIAGAITVCLLAALVTVIIIVIAERTLSGRIKEKQQLAHKPFSNLSTKSSFIIIFTLNVKYLFLYRFCVLDSVRSKSQVSKF